MTKKTVIALVMTLVVAAPATAQEALNVLTPFFPELDPLPEAREYEDFIWKDDEYEGFRNLMVVDVWDEGAYDLRGMYYREAFVDGVPALVMTVALTGGDTTLGEVGLDISLSNGDQAYAFSLTTTDGQTFVHDVASVVGPYALTDDLDALDVAISYDAMGADVGDEITDIVFMSKIDGANADAMPGGWYHQGSEMQWMTEHWPDGGRWNITGVPALAALTVPDEVLVDPHDGAPVSVSLENLLVATDQDATLSLDLPDDLQVDIESTQARLGPSATGTAEFTITHPTIAHDAWDYEYVPVLATVHAVTDLGQKLQQDVTVMVPVEVPEPEPEPEPETTHMEPMHGDEDHEAPAGGVLLGLAAVGAAMVARRR